MTFWDTFWPTLAATVIGVIPSVALGFPLALAVDRRVRARAAGETERQDAVLLGQLRASLCDAIDRNVLALHGIASLPAGEVKHVSGLELALWDVWRDDAIRLLNDPILRGDLALFFGDLLRIEGLNQELVRLYTSTDALKAFRATDTRLTVRELLIHNAAQAVTGGQEVRARLAQVM
jgi:hypothetical protein